MKSFIAMSAVTSVIAVGLFAQSVEASPRGQNWKTIARAKIVKEAVAYRKSLPSKIKRPSYAVRFTDKLQPAIVGMLPAATADVTIRGVESVWNAQEARVPLFHATYDAQATFGGVRVKNTSGWMPFVYAQ